MLNIGIIGMGGISNVHLASYCALAERARIVARCDKIPERARGTAGEVTINIEGGADSPVVGTPYTEYQALLADPAVEAVDICLPTDLHAEVAIAALEAGKHVLCEKPMALTLVECERMIAAAQAAGRTLMIAHCIRFWPEYLVLKELVDSRRYGALQHASFSRLSGPPLWSSENWMMTPARSGGAILDLHIHDADFITFLLGMPQRVSAVGRVTADGGMDYIRATYDYGDGLDIIAEGGWLPTPNFPFHMTFRAVFEEAAIQMDHGPLTIYPTNEASFTPDLASGNGYSREIEYFLDCVEGGHPPALCTPAMARDSIRLIHAEMAAAHFHHPVPV